MRRVALVLLMVAACSHEGGLLIDVTPTDPSVDQVRIYIGTGDATSNQTLGLPFGPVTANPQMPPAISGVTYWSRDPGNELDTRAVGPGETARFVLVHTNTDTIPALLAVGYANGKIVQVATKFDTQIPNKRFALFTLKLQAPVGDLTSTSNFAAGAWDPDNQTTVPNAACVGVFEQGARFPRSFIVSPDDQDCDGFIDGSDAECTPDIYRGTRPATLDEVSCLSRDTALSSCLLGGPPCADNTKRDLNACQPTPYCTPYSVCEGCSDLGCAKDVSKLPLGARPAMYTCAVHVSGSAVCENDIILDNLPSAGLSCTEAAIADKTHPFAKKLDANAIGIQVGVDQGCHVTLKPSGDVPSVTPTLELGSMVAVTFQGGRGLAVPVVLKFDAAGGPGCLPGNMAVHCTPDAVLAQTELTRCVTSGAGPTPVGLPLGAINPTLTGDMLEIWFTTPPAHLWHASRSSVSAGWSPPLEDLTLELGGTGLTSAGTPHVSRDGLTMYLSADRGMGVLSDIYRTVRLNRTATWSVPVLVPGLSSSNAEGGAATNSSEQVAVFHRKDNAAANFTIRTASGGGGVWTAVAPAIGLQAQGNSLNPVLSDDGLTIYYANDGTGPFDLFEATRQTEAGPFGPPELVPGVNSTAEDVDPWVSSDGKTIYFASNRSAMGFQIYMAQL